MFIYFSLFLSIIISYFTNIIPHPLHFGYGYDLSISLGNQYNNSVMKNIYLSSWNLLDLIILIFIKIGISSFLILKIFYFITTFLISYSLTSIMYTLSNSKLLSVLTVLFQYITFFNIGFGDYPGWIVSPHLHFLFSQSIILICLVFFIKQKFQFFFGTSILIIGFHAIMGFWFLFNFIILFFFLNNQLKSKILLSFKNNYYLYISIIILLISLFFSLFISNNYFSLSYYENLNSELILNMKIYLDNWDYHRSIEDFHKNTIIRIFIILFMLIYLFFKIKRASNIIYFITIIIINSLLFFVLDRVASNYDILEIKRFMPSRFMNQSSFFSLIIISAFIFQLMKDIFIYFGYKNFYKTIKLIHIILICSFLYIFSILDPTALGTQKNINKKNNIDIHFWNEVKKKKIKGSILTSYESSIYSTIYGKKIPLIFNFGYDFLPYHPEYLGFFKQFVGDFLAEDFSAPSYSIKNKGYIPDELLKKNIENFSIENWRFLAQKYSLSALILPKNWNINLNAEIHGNKFKYYELDNKND